MFSSTLRSLATFHYLKPQIIVRFKHTALEAGFIEKKLGLPLSPKKPLAPYFQYMTEIRRSVIDQHPKLKTTDYSKLIGKMWKLLDDTIKAQYSTAYQNALITYRQQLDEYNRTISENDQQAVKEKRKEIKTEIKKRKCVRLQRKKALSLDRPKRPAQPFLKFLGAWPDRQPDEKCYDYLRRKSAEFKNLSESEKEVFVTSAGDMQNYKNDLMKWKGKMIKLGEYDVIESEIPKFRKLDILTRKSVSR